MVQFSDKIGLGEEFTGPKPFQPEAYPAFSSSKFCEFCTVLQCNVCFFCIYSHCMYVLICTVRHCTGRFSLLPLFQSQPFPLSALRITILLADIDDEEEVDEGDNDDDKDGDEKIGIYHVVNILPVVESDQLKGCQHAPQQIVKACEPE